MEIAGRIPRVTQSMLGGEFGKLSRNLTLQKALKVATFGKLQNLPTLPVIGAIATDKPRTFQFNISAPLDNPKDNCQNNREDVQMAAQPASGYGSPDSWPRNRCTAGGVIALKS